jgi:predicted small secreted protein
MKRFGRRISGITVIGIMLLVTACNTDEGATSTATLPPIGSPSNTVPPTTATTVVASTEAPPIAATSTIPLPAGACVFSPPGGTADVTFEVATRLYSVNPGSGTSSCLSELTADNVGPFQWSPAGDRVLLNSVTVFDGTQALPSGYFSTNTGVSWSYPTGKALIAPAVADSHLLWRTAGQPETRTDISFLERTDVARYHPAGRDIFAAGQAADGAAGLFIAGNRGENPRLIAQLDQPSTEITEIAPDPSGSRVFFIHDHHNGTFHVHALDLPQLTLTDLAQVTEPLAKLTVGTTPSASIAWRIGACSGLTRTQVAGPGGVTDQPAAFVALSTEPVGWLDSQQLVVSARTGGCTGPSDLWIWNIATAAATPLVSGVDNAAVRAVLIAFGELPGDINSTAPT